MNLTVKNALTNAFIDYYSYRYMGLILQHCVVTIKDVRRVNTHMKLTGKDFLQELQMFISEIEKWDENYDFSFDYYENEDGIPLKLFCG